jgi:hypothetical protein
LKDPAAAIWDASDRGNALYAKKQKEAPLECSGDKKTLIIFGQLDGRLLNIIRDFPFPTAKAIIHRRSTDRTISQPPPKF